MAGYDPNDPNMGSQMEAGQAEAANQDILRSLTERVRQDRAYQQWLAARGGRLSEEDRKQAAAILQQSGTSIPEGMEVQADGSVAPIDRTTRNRLLVAGMAAPLFLPGGGAAAAGGAAAPTMGGGTTLAANLGGASALPGAAATVPTLGGGTTLAANLGPSSALPSASGSPSMLSRLSRFSDTATDLGDMFTSGAQASAAGRAQDDFARMNAATANNRARVDVGAFNMDAPQTRARQVARGDLMAAQIPQSQRTGEGRNVSFSGGVGPQYFGADTTQAGNELKRQGLSALMNGSDQIEPELVTPSRAGMGENIMGGVGTGLNVLGILGKLRR